MDDIAAILTELREATGSSRATLRRDVPGAYRFPVVSEVCAPGVGSLLHERSVDLSRQPVVLLLLAGQQVVQSDSRAAFDDDAYQKMLDAYGGLAAQIVTPVLVAGNVEAILSLHQLGEPRAWSDEEVARATQAAERIGSLL